MPKSSWVYSLLFLLVIISKPVGSFSDSFEIKRYKLTIEPDFSKQSVKGHEFLKIKRSSQILNTLTFFIYKQEIKQVKVNSEEVHFSVSDQRLSVPVPSKWSVDETLELEITYTADKPEGLVFGKDYVYSNFETCSWMICRMDPGRRSPFEFEVKIPSKMKLVSSHVPYNSFPGYLYGFAAGYFYTWQVKTPYTTLKFLSSQELSKKLRKNIADTTTEAIAFFVEKTGISYPHRTYSQVFAPGYEAQEKHPFAIIGLEYVDAFEKNPKEDWVFVHELAHQWWGNAITCKTWDHFWLNEGLVVFMTAAFKQQKWGQPEYDRELVLAKKRYQVAIDAGFDVPLTFSGEYPPGPIRRGIIYSKGFLFVDSLRRELGEEKFWLGIKLYTQKYFLHSVTSQNFQRAMETASGKDLSDLFKKWVY